MASSSDQGPRGILFARRWKVFHYFHIANRYCTNAMPLAKGRLRHPAYLIVDTQRIQEWEETHGPHIPCPNCIMFVQKGIMGQSEDYERADWHGYGRMRYMGEDATLQVEEVSFNWLGSLVDDDWLRQVSFESLLPIPHEFIGYHLGVGWCYVRHLPEFDDTQEFRKWVMRKGRVSFRKEFSKL